MSTDDPHSLGDRPSPARSRTLLYAIPLGVLTIAGTIGVAFMPYLLARAPLVLIALSPLFRHLVLVSPVVDTASLFAVAVPRHFAPDPFVYLLGLQYGPLAVEWAENNSPLLGKTIRGLERLFAKVGPVALIVSPDIAMSTLAGVARVRFSTFVIMNLVGTVANVVVAKWFGQVLERQIQTLVAFFQSNLLAVTAASLLIFGVLNWWSTRKQRRAS